VQYFVLEPSADLRQRQHRALEAFAGRVHWLDRLPETQLSAVVVANEVLDALPVTRFTIDGGEPKALGVVADGDGIGWGAGRAVPELTEAVRGIELALQQDLRARDPLLRDCTGEIAGIVVCLCVARLARYRRLLDESLVVRSNAIRLGGGAK
jgi:hypothetical protein